MSVRRIENATVLPMSDGVAPISPAVVEWEDKLITYVGPVATAPSRPADEVIDGSDCVVIPGLVNAHTHLAMTLFRGFADDMPLKSWLEERIWPTEMKLVEEDVYWGTRLGILELLRGGVTCFNDMYHYYETATHAAIDGRIRACPAGVLLGFLPNAEELLDQALEFTARMKASHSSRVHPMLGPHAPYTCPDRLLRRVAEGAAAQDIPIHIHLSETRHEVEESLQTRGMSPVRHLDELGVFQCHTLAAHCVWLDNDDIETLAAREVAVAHCPGSNMKLGNGFAPLPRLLERGAVVALATDGAASNNNLDLFEEMYLAAVIHKGHAEDPTVVTAGQALAMATREGARALGIGHLVGTLEPGKRADLALVSLRAPHLQPVHNVVSHLVYAARAADVTLTVVDGEIVMRDGCFPGQDADEVYRECAQRARRLCHA